MMSRKSVAHRRPSKPSDTGENLQWAIKQLVDWEYLIEERSKQEERASEMSCSVPAGSSGARQTQDTEDMEQGELTPLQDKGAAEMKEESKEEEHRPMPSQDFFVLDHNLSTSPAKLIFVEKLLESIMQSALKCVKLRAKVVYLQGRVNMTQPGTTARALQLFSCKAGEEEKPAPETMRLGHELKRMTRLLKESLGHFDTARATARWLQRDYLLVKQKAEQLEHRRTTQFELQRAEQQGDQKAVDKIKRQHMSSCQAMIKTEKELKQNDCDALVLGLNFVDTHCRGFIEPDDLPELTAKQFVALDLDNNHKISPSELTRATRKALDRACVLEEELHVCEGALAELEHRAQGLAGQEGLDSVRVEVVIRKAQKEELQAALAVERALLEAVKTFFHDRFLKHVWNHLLDIASQDSGDNFKSIQRIAEGMRNDEAVVKPKASDAAEAEA